MRLCPRQNGFWWARSGTDPRATKHYLDGCRTHGEDIYNSSLSFSFSHADGPLAFPSRTRMVKVHYNKDEGCRLDNGAIQGSGKVAIISLVLVPVVR